MTTPPVCSVGVLTDLGPNRTEPVAHEGGTLAVEAARSANTQEPSDDQVTSA